MLVQNLSAFFLKTKQFVDTDKESLVTSRSSVFSNISFLLCLFMRVYSHMPLKQTDQLMSLSLKRKIHHSLAVPWRRITYRCLIRPPMQKGARHFFTYTQVFCSHCKILNPVCHFQAPTICPCRCSKQSEQAGQEEVET